VIAKPGPEEAAAKSDEAASPATMRLRPLSLASGKLRAPSVPPPSKLRSCAERASQAACSAIDEREARSRMPRAGLSGKLARARKQAERRSSARRPLAGRSDRQKQTVLIAEDESKKSRSHRRPPAVRVEASEVGLAEATGCPQGGGVRRPATVRAVVVVERRRTARPARCRAGVHERRPGAPAVGGPRWAHWECCSICWGRTSGFARRMTGESVEFKQYGERW